jgi:integrase
VVRVLYLTGWRLGEVLPLQWAQLEFAAGVVRLEPGTTKNAEGRVFPFGALPHLRDLLHELRAQTEAREQLTGQPVLSVFHRNGMPVRDFRGAWEQACIAAGFSRVVNPDASVRPAHESNETAP